MAAPLSFWEKLQISARWQRGEPVDCVSPRDGIGDDKTGVSNAPSPYGDDSAFEGWRDPIGNAAAGLEPRKCD